jgi:hypothetical protein
VPLETDGQWLLDTLRSRDERYRLALAYYAGEHRLRFATEKWTNAFGQTFREFADNLCAPVVDAYTDRLQVRGFDAQGTGEREGNQGSPAERAVEALWRDNRLDVQSGQVHHDALLCGDGYVIVWRPDPPPEGGPVLPVIYPQSPRRCAVAYDDEIPGRVVLAGKAWRQRDRRVRLTLYYADHLERYVTRRPTQGGIPETTKGFVPFDEDAAGAEVRNEWNAVPVFHFANAKGVGQAGVSVLEPVFALNDALNKAFLDMLVSMEFVSYPQRWASGIEAVLDPVTGKESPAFKPGPERVWLLENPEARIGQLDQGSLEQHVRVQESIRQEIARVSGVPGHLLLGVEGGRDWPSGEALRNAEARLVKRAEDLMTAWGPVWSGAMMLALRMAADDVPEVLETLWVPPETRQERAQAETGEIKRRLGVSREQVLRELGYTEEQREAMAGERSVEDEERAARIAAGGLG